MVEFLSGLSVLDFLQSSFRIHLVRLQTQHIKHPSMVHHVVLAILTGFKLLLETPGFLKGCSWALENAVKIQFWHQLLENSLNLSINVSWRFFHKKSE